MGEVSLPRRISDGETPEEAIQNGKDALEGWIATRQELGLIVPKPNSVELEPVKLVARLPRSLHSTLQKQAKQEGGFPFPLLANPEFTLFKKYRCFDDFDNKPIHGTFLLDQQRMVRWQDIGAEPFTDAPFLLQEAKRLLSLPNP